MDSAMWIDTNTFIVEFTVDWTRLAHDANKINLFTWLERERELIKYTIHIWNLIKFYKFSLFFIIKE